MKFFIITAAALCLVLSGCTTTTVDRLEAADVENQAERALFNQTGVAVQMVCGDSLPAKVDEFIVCVSSSNNKVYDTKIIVTEVDEEGNVSFAVEVADAPN